MGLIVLSEGESLESSAETFDSLETDVRLKDKVAVITGAAQGIGLGIAQRFATEGARVMMLDINAEIGGKAAQSIKNAVFLEADVSQKSAIDAAVATVIEQTGQIDVCVNNAGIL
ncbi:MAG: SDR family NAD(P)-dependent oxidoreductase, partial [Rhodobacteraceae bacterium]|nr:SDR family NAD(P)-dependent oxidoreductase [Paracoccaceae bacterium]